MSDSDLQFLNSTVDFWMNSAGRAPLLTGAQEIQLGHQIQAWLTAEDPDARTIKCGKRAKDKFIRCNLRFIATLSRKYIKRISSNAALSIEDLMQEGVIGLNRAAEKFDPEAGYKFSTYAYWWIRQAMTRYCDMNTGTIHIPIQAHSMAMKWKYRPEGQSLEDFAAEQDMTAEKAREWLALVARADCVSLDKKATMGEESTKLIDLVAGKTIDDESIDIIDAFNELSNIEDGGVRDAIAALQLAENYSKTEMGELLGLHASKVSRRLKDLKATVREHCPEDIRQRICGIEKPKLKIVKPDIPLPVPLPARELALVYSCSPLPEPVMTLSTQPTANGHAAVSTEALERLVEAPQAEPVNEAPKPRKRVRRSREEIAAERDSEAVSLTINNVSYEGSPQAIASVLKAMAA